VWHKRHRVRSGFLFSATCNGYEQHGMLITLTMVYDSSIEEEFEILEELV